METRRMMIEDFELMGHARRAYLGWVDAQEAASAEEAARAEILRADTRLEGALLMEWELRPDFDAAVIHALEFCKDRGVDDLAPQGIPAHELPLYLERRAEAIERVIKRLRGEI